MNGKEIDAYINETKKNILIICDNFIKNLHRYIHTTESVKILQQRYLEKIALLDCGQNVPLPVIQEVLHLLQQICAPDAYFYCINGIHRMFMAENG
jgi:hypothetical protein